MPNISPVKISIYMVYVPSCNMYDIIDKYINILYSGKHWQNKTSVNLAIVGKMFTSLNLQNL